MRIGLLGRVSTTVLLMAGSSAALPPAPAATAGPGAGAPATQNVSYLGHDFVIPASWPVVRLAAGSTTCVRFDKHAVYLGAPPADQHCPATTMGRTEALVIQPAQGPVAAEASADPVSHEIDASAPGIAVTATYSSNPLQVTAILTSAGLPLPATESTYGGPLQPSQAAPALAVSADSTRYTGLGIDPCSAPSASAMNAWRTGSPYRAIGIYLGGANMACTQPNLTASWVSTQAAAGWHFFLLYVGPQAPGSSCTSCSTITSASAQGASAAQDAATRAASLGFGAGSPIIYDMEAYSPSSAPAALSFISSWTNELRALGYVSGEYSSLSSGINDLIGSTTGSAMPGIIDFASWDGDPVTGSASIPDADWANHERIHQYSGGVNQTFGGYTINVDQDYLDVQGSFSTPVGGTLGDVTGDGRSDILAIAANGDLLEYPNARGTGINTFGSPTRVGSGWTGYTLAAVTDLHAFGRAGLLAVALDGTLLYYPNTGGSGTSTFGPPTEVGTGWIGYTVIGAADLYSVGRPGLLAVAPDGTLYYYPNAGGTGTGTFGQPTQVGSGWNGWTVDVADINGDAKPDLLAVDSDGALYCYPNIGGTATGTFGQPAQAGSGWNGWRAMDAGTLSGTGPAGILGIDSTGTMYEFPNATSGATIAFGPSDQVGSGWVGYAVN